LGSLKDKVYKTTPHTLEELRNITHCEISTISREELQRVKKNVFRRHLNASDPEGNIFSMCCSIGEFY
jgi:hypothetical protein